MISILVYGRNDSHGYNLHKRVALSLNCMAAVLTDPSDEIIFVDYNTQDDFPTLPEAIRDTLTPETCARLRILRVRPAVHARYQSQTHLVMAEPVARNVAVRRSNPANRWVLATNTDMIFTPRTEKSLTELVRDLPAGYYGIPRFELPESLWESLDRQQPRDVLAQVADWGKKFHLNEAVYMLDVVRFDGPGDFQLATREDYFKVQGFDESMLLGWHVDSNLCKRMYFLNEVVGDLSDGIYGYHCGHTRQLSLLHRHRTAENSFDKFVYQVTSPGLPAQAETWGLAQDELEEIRLDGSAPAFPAIMEKLAGPPLEKPLEQMHTPETFDTPGYEAAHVMTFLADLFANARRDTPLAWVGVHARMFDLFLEIRKSLGFTGPVLVCGRDAEALSATKRKGVEVTDVHGICNKAGEFIFDFVRGNGGAIGTAGEDAALALHLGRTFRAVVAAEQARMAKELMLPLRRVIAINTIHNRFAKMVTMALEAGKAPFNTRLRYGPVVAPAPRSHDWLPLARAGAAGFRRGSGMEARTGEEGMVVQGPYLGLSEGRYRAHYTIETEKPGMLERWKRKKRAVLLDVISRTKLFGFYEIFEGRLKGGAYYVDFEISREDTDAMGSLDMEARVWTNGKQAFMVTSIVVERIGDDPIKKGK